MHPRLAGFLVALLAVLLLGSGVVGADGYDVRVTAPDESSVGAETTISGSVSVPDQPGDWQADVTVTLVVDGEQVGQRSVTVRDGQTTTVEFSHAFESSGEHRVRVTGETSYGRWSYEDSAETTVTVPEPSTAAPTVEATPPDTGQQLQGAAFSVPASLTDEVEQARSAAGDLGPNAFVLATQDSLYLVFTTAEPTTGAATVQGTTTGTTVTADGLTYGVVAASSVSIQTRGEAVSLEAVASRTDDYALELVQVSATDQRVASLTNTDDGSDVTAASNGGVLTSEAIGGSVVADLDTTAAAVVSGERDQVPFAARQEAAIATVAFESAFWHQTQAPVHGLVLPEDSPARRYVATVAPSDTVTVPGDGALLYVVHTDLDARSVDIERVAAGDVASGELVQFSASVVQGRVSVEEGIERNTACGDDAVPVKEACVPLTQDVLLHGGVAWTGTPDGPEDTVVLVGASARHQEAVATTRRGEYRITGELVAPSEVGVADEGAGQVLVVHGLERRGSIRGTETAVVTDGMARLRERFRAGATASNATVRARLEAQGTAAAATPPPTRATSAPDRQRTTASPTGSNGSGAGFGGVGGLIGVGLVLGWRWQRRG